MEPTPETTPASRLDRRQTLALKEAIQAVRLGDRSRYEAGIEALFAVRPDEPRVAHRMAAIRLARNDAAGARDAALAAFRTGPSGYLALDLLDAAARLGDAALFHRAWRGLADAAASGFKDIDEGRLGRLIGAAAEFGGADALRLRRLHKALGDVGLVRALAGGDPGEAANPVLIDLGRALEGVGRGGGARACYVRALRSAATPAEEAQALRRLWVLEAAEGERAALVAWLRRLKRRHALTSSEQRRLLRNLRLLGRGALVDRYVRRLERACRGGGLSPDDMAVTLWAAERPRAFLDWIKAFGLDRQTHASLILAAHGELAELFAMHVLLREAPGAASDLKPEDAPLLAEVARLADAGEVRGDDELRAWVLRALKDAVAAAPPRGMRRRKTRILLAASSLSLGGSERQLATLLKAAAVRYPDTRLRVFTWHDREAKYVTAEQSEPPEWMRSKGAAPAEALGPLLPLAQRLFFAERASELAEAIHAIDADVVHCMVGNLNAFVLGAFVSGAPRVVIRFGGAFRAVQRDGTDRFDASLARMVQLLDFVADDPRFRVFANSRAARDDWAQRAPLPNSRIEVIYNGVDEVFFADTAGPAAALRSAAGIPADAPVLGGVFRLHQVKDPLRWVRVAALALERVPQAHAVLLGDGPLAETVRLAVHGTAVADRFHLIGEITEHVEHWYGVFRAVLLTSQSESLPNTLLEAQAQGAAAIAPDVGGVRECVLLGRVFAHDAGDAAVADMVANTLAAPPLDAAALAALRADLKDRFGEERMVDDIFGLYGVLPPQA